ncbi:MAG TPA: histidine phosphatase family protein [Ramlibacter sp.]|jgi:phosphohistidine phosphatase SixA|uniref:histidine phosphatase family protein n=1 Tax=Ramlibacter sp. TaxID=1917967 RepID=UPI002D4243F7|nr:histidine phosphatase family protein [Ramlibacter sp.]HZY17391.1 histidine phosphatase family protein [Ramlibacter sp.]
MARALCCLLSAVLLAGAPAARAADPIASATSSAPAPGETIAPRLLAAALRRGGWVVYIRHTATDFSRNDSGMAGYDDCAHQRLLSEAGRAQARAIGQRIRDLRLPVTEVLASPYCRTMDTARLIFGQATPRDVIRERAGDDYPGLKQLLAAPVAPGAIRWVVGHGTPFRAVAGAPHLAEGEAAVLRPQGRRWSVVARIRLEDWADLRD